MSVRIWSKHPKPGARTVCRFNHSATTPSCEENVFYNLNSNMYFKLIQTTRPADQPMTEQLANWFGRDLVLESTNTSFRARFANLSRQ